MARLFTQTQVRALARTVGFKTIAPDKNTPADDRIISAIAMCEAPASDSRGIYSDFDLVGDQALADKTWGFSYGGVQIRSKRADSGSGRPFDEKRLAVDELFVMKTALLLRNTQGWRAWTTFNTGQYKAFLQDVYKPPAGTYAIQPGDGLIRITAKLGNLWRWEALAYVNGLLKPWTIVVGRSLLLPWINYEVQSGDNLITVAANYAHGVTYQQVADFNEKDDPNKLEVGETLRLPRASYLEYLAVAKGGAK